MIKQDIEDLIKYLWYDEKQHYEENEKPKDHIFLKIKRLDNWLNSPSCPLTEEGEE